MEVAAVAMAAAGTEVTEAAVVAAVAETEATEAAGMEVTVEATVIKPGVPPCLALCPLSLQIIQEVDDHRGFSIPFSSKGGRGFAHFHATPILPISKFTATHSLSIICIVHS